MVRRKYLLLTLILFVAIGLNGTVSAEETTQTDKWEFAAEIYLWAATIDVDSASGNELEIDFGDILTDLEMTFMGVFGARKGKWSFMLDAIYLDIKGSKNLYIPDENIGIISAKGSEGITSWIVTPSIGYNLIQTERVLFDVLAGARYLYLKSDTKIDFNYPLSPINKRLTISDSIWDGIVGLRGYVNLSKNWYLPYYADIGIGDSNVSWQVFGGVGYRFKLVDLILAYRYLDWNFDSGDVVDDLNVRGPFVGVKFKF